jgi:CCR4-NOT transcription complex subunit 7/8
MHQGPHIQQQHQQSLQHPGFGGGNATHNLNLFGPSQNSFQSNAALGGGLGGAGLGAAAGIGSVTGGTGLDGHEARMRFAHGAQLQQEAALGRGHDGTKGMGQRIREVWKGNLHQEMDMLRSLVDQYPYISMVSIPLSLFTSLALSSLNSIFLRQQQMVVSGQISILNG